MKGSCTLVVMFVFVMVGGVTFADEIQITPGRLFDYYHLRFEFTPENSRPDESYGFTSEGQFMIFTSKDAFPVSAPDCAGDLIIRMPASLRHPSAVSEKRALYERFAEMFRQQRGSVTAVLELNPDMSFVRVFDTDPPQYELTKCNVFFRQKNGRYHDQL